MNYKIIIEFHILSFKGRSGLELLVETKQAIFHHKQLFDCLLSFSVYDSQTWTNHSFALWTKYSVFIWSESMTSQSIN